MNTKLIEAHARLINKKLNESASRAQIDSLKNRFPKGARVKLLSIDDLYTNLAPGDLGTVIAVDDIGTIHVKWDNGSTLGLAYGVDFCTRIENSMQSEANTDTKDFQIVYDDDNNHEGIELTKEQFYAIMDVRNEMIKIWEQETYSFEDEKAMIAKLNTILNGNQRAARGIYNKFYNEIDPMPDDLI